jgi:hypothetical protein
LETARCTQFPKEKDGLTITRGVSRVQFATKRLAILISLLLLQSDYSTRSMAIASGGSSYSATTHSPSPSPVANPLRFSPSPGSWVNVTSNLAGMSSQCGNMTYVSAKPNEDLMIAGIALRGLWGSTDGGTNWHQLGSGSGSAAITNRPGSIIYDPVRPNVFWESGIYSSNGVYRTNNDGNAFQALGSIGHNDTVSVDFTDRNRQTLLAGGHEQKQTVYRTQDGGNTWANVGVNLPAGTAFSSYPLVINSKTFFAGCFPSWGGGTGGIYQSNDRGPLGVSFRPKAEADNLLLQVMDPFTGRVKTALCCEEQVKARIGYDIKPCRAVLLGMCTPSNCPTGVLSASVHNK